MTKQHVFVIAQDGSLIIAHVNESEMIIERENIMGKVKFFFPLCVLKQSAINSGLAEYLGEL